MIILLLIFKFEKKLALLKGLLVDWSDVLVVFSESDTPDATAILAKI